MNLTPDGTVHVKLIPLLIAAFVGGIIGASVPELTMPKPSPAPVMDASCDVKTYHQVAIGDTMAQVRLCGFGAPDDVTRVIIKDYVSETWAYKEPYRKVMFSNGQVIRIVE